MEGGIIIKLNFIDFIIIFNVTSIFQEMEKQVKAGRAKSIGLSNFNQTQIANIYNSAEIKPSNLQVKRIHGFFLCKIICCFDNNQIIGQFLFTHIGRIARVFTAKETTRVLQTKKHHRDSVRTTGFDGNKESRSGWN